MAGPLIATKLYAPKLRGGLVARPRLLERLRRGADAKLTLVSAPAGFGKTTLLAEWLAEGEAAGDSLAWLSLDPADNEPASFWTYLVTALQGSVPSVGVAALDLIAASPLPTDPMLTTLVNELARAPGRIWLVLDDYHVIENHDIRSGLTFLLEHLPPQVHVVLSTRADPDLPLSRWRVRGEVVEIRAADLRFTAGEVDTYLTVVAGLDLAAADIAVLEERTEGWIAALQLAGLSLQGRTDVSGFIARFAGDDRYLVDYLIEEVLTHQTAAVRSFLLQSAVLDRLSGPLCDAVTGRADGSRMIRDLERANLFIVPLDDRREWYRYHHLFADVLRARLLSEQPEQVPLLHQRASQWYERHDLTEESIRHALAAEDFDRAVRLIELAVSEVRRSRQEALMHSWLKALPDHSVRRSPVLSLFYGSMLMASGALDGVEPWLADAERALAAVPQGSPLPWADTDDLRTLPSTVALYRAALAQARGDVAGTAEHARRALDLAGAGDHLARGGAAGFLGFAAWARGDVTGALEIFSQAVASLHAAGSLVDALSSTVVLADLWLAIGRPSRARRLCTQALELAGTHGAGVARATAELRVRLSEIDIESGDLETARRQLETAAALADRVGMNEGRFRWFVAKALLVRAEGDLEGAVQLLGQAEQLYRPGFYPDVRPIAALKARIWIVQNRLPEAADWARDRGVSATDDARYLREFDHLTLVRLLLARHRADQDLAALDQASVLLDRVYAAAATAERAGSLIEIRLLQALVRDAQGRRALAMETLSQAVERAPEPEHYTRLFLDEGAAMLSLLRDAEMAGVGGNHVRRLLHRGAATEAQTPGSGPPVAHLASESLSDRELQVLRLLNTDLTGPEIARALFVSHNTVRTHTKHIFTKLDVTNRRAAISRARERGLI